MEQELNRVRAAWITFAGLLVHQNKNTNEDQCSEINFTFRGNDMEHSTTYGPKN